MPKDKSTGKKLADMMYGNPDRAAFGITPMIGKRREDRQDRQAAKSFPVDLARGVVAGAVGLPGDIESLARLPYELITGNESPTFLPTSEDVLKRIPFGTNTPAGQFASGLGTLAGGSAPIGPVVSAAKALPGALSQAQKKAVQAGMKLERGMEPVVKKAMESGGLPREMVMAMGANSQSNVIKPKGGNWLGGNLMGNMDENVKRLKPYQKAGAQAGWQQKELEGAQASLERLKNDKYTSPRMVEIQQGVVDEIKKKIAINNWVESNLGKYVKNQMATPEDPIRLLLDKRTKEIEAKHAKDMERAERMAQRAMDEPDPRRQANMIRESDRLKIEANVERQFAMDSIIPSRMRDYSPEADYSLKQRRQEAGFPAEGMGESEAAKRYETLTDDAISSIKAGDVQGAARYMPELQDAEREFLSYRQDMMKRFEDHLRASGMSDNEVKVLSERAPAKEKAEILGDNKFFEMSNDYSKKLADFDRDAFGIGQQNPFIAKLDPETQLYSGNTADMGFDHVIDILKQDVMEGRIRPEQLSKVSVEDAMRRTMDFDQEAARKMAEAQIKNMEGFPVYKEYPEGYRWVELKKPEDLPEGYSLDDMGNVVDEKGHITNHPGEKRLEEALKYEGDTMGHCVGGYCPDVLEGKSRIFSLRDARGEPHVTVEVNPSSQRVAPRHEEIVSEMKASGLDLNQLDEPAYDAAYEQALQRVKQNRPPAIAQIKGKQNAAPKAEYLPYVQDFVKSGKYSEVGDLENTGLYSARDVMNYMPENFTMSRNARQLAIGRARMSGEMPDYMTKAEYEAMLQKHAPEDIWNAEKAQRAAEDDELLRQLQPPPEGMAQGGRVHFSDNPDVMQLELAKGGAVAALKRLARAPAKSKQEIEAIAERMAPQVTGEYVRKDAKSAKTVADKTQKQFQREKTLPVDVRATSEERVPQSVDIEKLKGNVMIGIPGDPTLAGKTLYGVGDVKLGSPSPQHGGPLYGLYNDENFWASGLGAARRVQNLAKEAGEQYDAPVMGKYVMMGPESINYAQHFADANLQAIDLSKMTKKQIEQFNELIRKGSPKSGPRESFPGIEDKGEAYLQMAIDPELRKHFNALMQMPTVTEKLNLPSGTDIRFAITEPSLRDLETGVTGFSMGKMRPDVASKDLPLSMHPTYSHDIPGEFSGQSRYPMPYELSFPDTLQSVRANPAQAASEFGSLKMVGPRQTIDQQMIDEIKAYEERMKQLTGKKAGGAVKVEQKVQVPMSSQKKSEQRVQNPVHFTESPDVMRLALTQRN